MLQKLPARGFECIKNPSQFNKFIKNYNGDNNKGYFLDVDVQYYKKLHDLHRDLSIL